MSRNEGHVTGELSEFKVASDLVEKGCRVSYTHGQYPYDLIADHQGDLLRIQVKTGNSDKGRSQKYRISTDGYDEADIDFFAGYAPDEDDVFYVPFSDATTTYAVTFTPRAQLSEINAERAKLAENHTFEKVIAQRDRGNVPDRI